MKKITAVLITACALALFSGCSSAGEKTAGGKNGEITASGAAECVVEEEGISYPVYVRVTADENGIILSAGDDGTKVPDGKDGKYKQAQAVFEEMIGKTSGELSEIDTVSGATASSEAILSAVKTALDEMGR